MNTINNSVSFGAKLDYSRLNVSKARWSKIASEFEMKTKKYPNDVFSLKPNGCEIFFHPRHFDNKIEKITGSGDYGVIPAAVADKLETFSADKVADVLKRMFMLREKADAMLTDYYSFEDKYNLTEKAASKIDEFYNKFWELREQYVKDRVNEDKVLKTLEGIEII